MTQTETDYEAGNKPIVSIRKAQLNLRIFPSLKKIKYF